MNAVLHTFFSPFNFRVALPNVWAGFQVNLKLMVVSEILVLILALAIAVVRGLPGRGASPFRALAIVYTDFFRGTPLILVAFLVGFGFPALGLGFVSSRSNFTYGVMALTLVYTAYVTEVYRAGIESVHPSQEAAARSLGLTRWQTLRKVILPQAVRRVIPPLLNDFIGLQKDTALVGTLGAIEAFNQAQIDSSATFNFTPFLVAALLFVAITIPLARFTDWLIARDRRRRQAQGVFA
jgi:polar amino acid transport system permease protein